MGWLPPAGIVRQPARDVADSDGDCTNVPASRRKIQNPHIARYRVLLYRINIIHGDEFNDIYSTLTKRSCNIIDLNQV